MTAPGPPVEAPIAATLTGCRFRPGRGSAVTAPARRQGEPRAWMRDHADARNELQGREEPSLPRALRLVAERLLQDVDRAGRERVVGLEYLAAVHRRRHDQDRGRTMRHDVFGGGEAAHQRQHHVHGHDVRTQPLAELDPLLAVDGDADELDLRIGLQYLLEPPADRRRIFHDEDADLRHRYAASCLMRARSCA